MSAVCRKRLFLDDIPSPISASQRVSKRIRSCPPGSAHIGTSTVGITVPSEGPTLQCNLPVDCSGWVELLLGEMTSAASIDDAKARASRLLESLEKTISLRAGVESAQNTQKENTVLKEQVEALLRDNTILKRAVAIQHERQKDQDDKSSEIQLLKQMVSQYQQQQRTLEVKNYALKMHLQQAQQVNSIPRHFNPDVF